MTTFFSPLISVAIDSLLFSMLFSSPAINFMTTILNSCCIILLKSVLINLLAVTTSWSSFEENSSISSFWVVPAVAPNCRALPLCYLEKLVLVGGATVRPDVCPQPTAGATVRLVCTLSSPLPGPGLTVEWCGASLGYLHTARLVVLL